MRLMVWILGVLCTLEGLMQAYKIAPAWVWVYWLWFGLWAVIGLVVMIAALARAAVAKTGGSAPRALVPRSAPPVKAQEGQ